MRPLSECSCHRARPGHWVLIALAIAAAAPAAERDRKSRREQPQPRETVAQNEPAPETSKPSLSRKEIEEGWIMLFDGEDPFGWTADGPFTIERGAIELKGGKLTSTSAFGDFELVIDSRTDAGKGAELVLNGNVYKIPPEKDWSRSEWTVESKGDRHTVKTGRKLFGGSSSHSGASHTTISINVPKGTDIKIRSVNLRPLGLKSIFNGKDLRGWKPLTGDKYQSKFTVTRDGAINVKNGPGDLQAEGEWQNFILQLEVISNGDNLNSGIFFRSLPGQFWQGYEAQIRNEWQGHSKDAKHAQGPEDRTKPVDIGTGGIYNRQPSRQVVSNDHEWFTYTILADGAHIALWVNGYQTADYEDHEADAPTAREGRYLGKGTITIQGHNGPGGTYGQTDLSFKNIRIAELPASPEKAEKK